MHAHINLMQGTRVHNLSIFIKIVAMPNFLRYYPHPLTSLLHLYVITPYAYVIAIYSTYVLVNQTIMIRCNLAVM